MPRSPLTSGVRRLVLGNALSALGTGMVLPLTLIYLHRVRHIPLPTTGLLLSLPSLVGLAAVPLSGTLMDRIGPRRVLVGCLVLLAVEQVALATVHTAASAIPVLVLQGVALGPTFPAFTTMLGRLAPAGDEQQRAFALNFTALNAAIGVGGLIGAATVDIHRPATFQVLFVANGLSSLVEALIIRSIALPPVPPTALHEQRPGYRVVLGDANLRRLLVIVLLLALTGYAALDSGLPAYANVVAGVSPRVIALSLSANTLLIVVAQIGILALLRGRRRTQGIAVVGLVWSASWLLLGSAALPDSVAARGWLVLAFAALFGLGETFMSPTVPSLTNALAGDSIRGRTNALASGMYSIAFMISPALSAGFIAAGLGWVWIALLCAGALVATVLAVRLGRRLSVDQDVGSMALPAEPDLEGASPAAVSAGQ